MLSQQEEKTNIPHSRLASKGIAHLEQQLSGDLAHHDELPQKKICTQILGVTILQ